MEILVHLHTPNGLVTTAYMRGSVCCTDEKVRRAAMDHFSRLVADGKIATMTNSALIGDMCAKAQTL